MANIKKKTTQTILKDFVIHPRQFCDYSAHCLGVLSKYIWLRKNQFNEDIKTLEYIKEFMGAWGVNIEWLNYFYKIYYKNYVQKVDPNEILTLKTDMYSWDNIEGGYKEVKRQVFKVLPCSSLVDEACVYSFLELYNLVYNGDIIVVDCSLSDEVIDEDAKGKFLRNVGMDVHYRAVDNYYAFNDSRYREFWLSVHENFCEFLRKSIISFAQGDMNLESNVNLNYKNLDL